jgi:hypothetical protein
VLGGKFPILLAPGPDVRHEDIPNRIRVRIFWNREGWFLEDDHRRRLFSFDLPTELFNLYADEGTLSRERALNLKERFMSVFQAIQTDGDRVRIINFELDLDWIEQIRLASQMYLITTAG